MDINEAHKRMMELVALMVDGSPEMLLDYGQDLAQLVESVNEWMSYHGDLPTVWQWGRD